MSNMDYVNSVGPEYRGYSDGLSGNAYAPFFGLPSGMDPMQAADKNRRYTHQDLSQNYMGKQNRFMETTILGLAHSDNDW